MSAAESEYVLRTERLGLRRFTAADGGLLVDLDSDPEVMHFVNGGRATPREEIEADYIPAYLAYYERYADYGFFVAELLATGDFIGWFHLRPAPGQPETEPELGYRLKRSVWGKGLAAEGSVALIDRAFARCGARRVVASTMADHLASRRVMEKCGMTLVREYHQDWPDYIPGAEHGDVEYAVARDEWRR